MTLPVQYRFFQHFVFASKCLFLLSFSMAFLFPARAQTFSIADFGAVADGKTNNAPAIQQAIDACEAQGGGRVYVPAGTFLTGTIYLKSNMVLYLEAGAVLKSTGKVDDLPQQSDGVRYLLVAENAQRVGMAGLGAIEGTGEADYGIPRNWKGEPPAFRYYLVKFDNCQEVTVKDISLRYSEMFTLLLHRCEKVRVDGIRILNNYFRANTDGIDPSESKDVQITNCYIVGGDDGICFKNGAENVLIANCIIQSPSSGIKFGTSTAKTFRNIRVDQCIIYNSMVGIGLFMKDGGLIEDCSFTNISIANLADTAAVNEGIARQQVPIYIDVDKRREDSPLGTVRNLHFENIQIRSSCGILLQGMKAKPIENITLRNISFYVESDFPFTERKKPKGFADSNFLYHSDHRLTEFIQQPSYVTIAHAHGVQVSNLTVHVPSEIHQAFSRQALGVYHAKGLRLQEVMQWAGNELLPAKAAIFRQNSPTFKTK